MASKLNICYVFEAETGETVSSVSFISEGIEETAKICTTSGGRYVMKLHETELYESPAGFLAGVVLMEQVAEHTQIPVPNVVVHRSADKSIFGTPFQIIEFVEGRHFDVEQDEIGSETHRQLLYELGRYLGMLHSVNCDLEYGWLGFQDGQLEPFGGAETNTGFIEYMLCEDFISDIKERDSNGDRFEDIVPMIERTSKLAVENVSLESGKAFCHWDLKYENILISEDGEITSILDWDNPIVGSPLFNLVKTERNMLLRYLVSNEISDGLCTELRQVIREGYQETSPFSFDFDSKSVQREIDVYEYYTVLDAISNFDVWFVDATEEETAGAEEFYKNRVREFYAMFNSEE